MMLGENVALGERIILVPQCRILYQRGVRCERCVDAEYGRQIFIFHLDQFHRFLCRFFRFRRDRRNRLSVVIHLVDGDHRSVLHLRSESRDRLRKVPGSHDQPDSRYFTCLGCIDRNDPRPGRGNRHQFCMQGIGRLEVRQISLSPGDATQTAGT